MADHVCPSLCVIEIAKRLRAIADDVEKQNYIIRAEVALRQVADKLEQDAIDIGRKKHVKENF